VEFFAFSPPRQNRSKDLAPVGTLNGRELAAKGQFRHLLALNPVQQPPAESSVSIVAQHLHEDPVSQDRMPLELSSLRIRQNRDSF